MAKKQTLLGQVFMIAIGMFMLATTGSDLYKFYSLSKNGKAAKALVVDYAPYVTHSKSGTRTHQVHVLFYDGNTEKIELSRRVETGTNIQVVYMPGKPEVAAEGAPGEPVEQLMGAGNFFSAMFMEIVGLIILAVGVFGGPMKFRVKINTNAGTDKKAQDGAGANVSNDSGMTNKTAVFSKAFKPLKISLGKSANTISKANDFEAKSISIVKFGPEAADSGYKVYLSGAEKPEEALSMELGYLTKPQLRDLILSAALLDKAASKKRMNVSLGVTTLETAVNDLRNEIPGYSEETYIKSLRG